MIDAAAAMSEATKIVGEAPVLPQRIGESSIDTDLK
jgi:hypothetical protein